MAETIFFLALMGWLLLGGCALAKFVQDDPPGQVMMPLMAFCILLAPFAAGLAFYPKPAANKGAPALTPSPMEREK